VRIAQPPDGAPPYPAIISIGRWLTLPKPDLDDLGIAVIYFPNDELGRQGGARDRGAGTFYDLYGKDHPAGSLMAWAWGVSRLIDVLEETPEARIDTERLGVTGCSRNGKGALVCGAFDARIVLTIPTESGAGGASSWRVADAMAAAGGNVQTARQIVTENTWMAPAFAEFGTCVDRLPVDQHMVAALCAPRALFVTENTAFEWLGREACYVTALAAHTVWKALGVPDRMGFVQTSHGDHCRFKETRELRAFCTKFLLDGEADTDVLKTDGEFELDPSTWIDWSVPATGPASRPADQTQPAGNAEKPAGKRVFYASHSLMWDMPPVLAQQVEAYGIENHTIVGHQRIGVSRARQHWNLPDERNQAKQALKAGNVDVFVMSPLVHPDQAITDFVELGLKHNPDMQFLIQISWPGLGFTDNEQFNAQGRLGGARRGFRGGFGGRTMFGTPADNKTPEDLATINAIDIENAETQVKQINKELGKGKTVAYLVPTAQAHNALRTLIYKKAMPGMTDQTQVFRDPIGHPTPPVVALNAYLHFAVLYRRSPVGLPMPDILANAARPEWNEDLNKKLQQLAWDLVTTYPPSGVPPSPAEMDERSEADTLRQPARAE
jgi:hypothetical protein